MRINRTPLILTGLALGLAGGIYLAETRLDPIGQQQAQASDLFAFAEEDVQRFSLQRPDITLELVLAAPGSRPAWQLVRPEKTPASDAAVAYLLNLLATVQTGDRFDLADNGPSNGPPDGNVQQRLGEFGLDQPSATLDITLRDGQQHRLLLGQADFSGRYLYALRDPDPDAEAQSVLLVPIDLAPAVERPLPEWRYTAELPGPPGNETPPLPGEEASEGASAGQEPAELPARETSPGQLPQPSLEGPNGSSSGPSNVAPALGGSGSDGSGE
jgi:hypothetical protein